MSVLAACILPHPPLAIPAVGRGREQEIDATIQGFQEIARRISELEPDTVILISPHAVAYADYFLIAPGAQASGDMSSFGAPRCRFQINYDTELTAALDRAAEAMAFPGGMLEAASSQLDHGSMVPLYYISPALSAECKLVRLSLTSLSPLEHYRWGMLLAEQLEALSRRAVIIASGDLSHRLREDGPYGLAPEGAQFDQLVVEAMRQADFKRWLSLDERFCSAAGECGLRSFQIMAGALDQQAVSGELLSYEAPFGVGYATAWFVPGASDTERDFYAQLTQQQQEELAARRQQEDPLVQLARRTLEQVVLNCHIPPLPPDLPAELLETRAGAFVSIKKDGQLRGCIGTIGPTKANLAREIVANTVSAGTHDPRFGPVQPDELDQLVYSVDVLAEPEAVSGPQELDPQEFGVIVTCGRRRGLLLPMLEGVDTVPQQLEIALRKAGIQPHEAYDIARFRVVRHY